MTPVGSTDVAPVGSTGVAGTSVNVSNIHVTYLVLVF